MNRRRLLAAIAAGGTVGVAGCLGGDGDGGDNGSTDNGGDNGNNSGDDGSTENGGGNGTGDPSTGGPDASFVVNPTEPEVGQSVTFDASDSTGDITAYRWDFTGDGETDNTGETATYAFEEAGQTTVTLTVETADGDTGETSRDVQVAPEPIAAFEWDPAGPRVGETITFDASETAGSIASYRWDFTGDGEIDDTGETVTRTFEESGEQFIELVVESTAGTVDDVIFSVEVSSAPRAAFDWSPEEPTVEETVTFDASETVGPVQRYEWDFDSNGEFDAAANEPTITHTFESGGVRTVTLRALGETGETNSVSETLEVTVDEEVELNAQFELGPDSPTVGEEVTFDGGSSQGDIAEYRWDFDGDGAFDRTTADPVLTHTFDEAGQYIVTLEIESADGQTEETSTEVPVREEDNDDVELELELSSTPEIPDAGEEVTFEFTRVEGEFAVFRWDFTDDGNTDLTKTEPNPVTRSFDDEGLNPVTVTGETASGETAVASTVVPIEPLPLELLANWEPSEPTLGDDVTFTVGNIGDNVVELRWDTTGDGTVNEVTPAAEGVSVSQTYDQPGTYQIVVEAEADDGTTVEFGTEFVLGGGAER
jgi:PKD repeat protein